MKKCDIKGCKEKAVWFTQTKAFCTKHHKEFLGECMHAYGERKKELVDAELEFLKSLRKEAK